MSAPKPTSQGFRDHAKDEIAKFHGRKKKKAKESGKRKKDLPNASQECILLQQHTMTSVLASDATSVTSTLTGATGAKCGSITLLQDVVILAFGPTSKPPIPVVIHSPMAHLTLLMGCVNEEWDCPNLCCVLDSDAALSTVNYHFMEAIIGQFTHILKKIYLPDNYAAIVLSGSVHTPNSLPLQRNFRSGSRFIYHIPPRMVVLPPFLLLQGQMLL